MASRLPRFRRATTIKGIKLTDRDLAILKLAYRHRILRSTHFISLLGGSSQQILRRFQLLFHHGFLERPRAQIDYFHRGGSRSIVYGLGNKGGRLLKEKFGLPMPILRWNEKNQNIRRMFLEHAIVVSDVVVALEVAVRNQSGVAFVPADVLSKSPQFRWRVRLNAKEKLGVVPDRVFALEKSHNSSAPERIHFFLECDRGTMPVIRKSLLQTSMYRKLLAYHATWKSGIHEIKFGFDRFRVLIVTTSEARTEKLLEACQKLAGGHGLFLFSDQKTLKKSSDIFSAAWVNGRGEPDRILP